MDCKLSYVNVVHIYVKQNFRCKRKTLVNVHLMMNLTGYVSIYVKVILRRKDGSVDFRREWQDYKNGFGSLDGEFWAGNCL